MPTNLPALARRSFLAISASAALTAVLRPVGVCGAPARQPADAPLTSEELEVVKLINGERASLLVASLTVRGDLICAARGHARDIVDTFVRLGECEHEGSDESSMADRVRRCNGKSVSREILGCSRPPFSPRGILEGWRGSEGHWKAITDPDQRYIGVAHIVTERTVRARVGTAVARNRFGAWVAVFDRA